MSLLHLVNQTRGVELLPVLSPTCYTISEHRNFLAAFAFKNNCDYLFMVDDDMTFLPGIVTELLSFRKDIISVPYHTKVFPKKITVLTLNPTDNPDKKLVEVSAVGTGIILIKTDVFLKIPQPWFSTDTTPEGFTTMGEDYWFCRKAREHGISIWSAPIECGHIGDYQY